MVGNWYAKQAASLHAIGCLYSYNDIITRFEANNSCVIRQQRTAVELHTHTHANMAAMAGDLPLTGVSKSVSACASCTASEVQCSLSILRLAMTFSPSDATATRHSLLPRTLERPIIGWPLPAGWSTARKAPQLHSVKLQFIRCCCSYFLAYFLFIKLRFFPLLFREGVPDNTSSDARNIVPSVSTL